MTINLKLQLTEDQLRRVRATYARGGKATRKECRVWLDRVIADAVQRLPEPKVRRKPPVPESKTSRVALARKAAEDAPDFALCERCGHRKDEHGRMGFACPAPHRSTFVPDPDRTREAQWDREEAGTLGGVLAALDTPFDDPNDLQDVEDEEAWAEAVAEGDARAAAQGGAR